MILHHTLLDKTGAAARMLIHVFNAEFDKGSPQFIPWLFETQDMRLDAPGEAVFDLGPEDAFVANCDCKGSNFTLILYEDPDGVDQPFVTLIENREAQTAAAV